MEPNSDFAWEVVATFSDVASAYAMAAMIRGEGVPAVVMSDSSLLGAPQ